ncbi:GTPase [Marinicella meishanensis]|uniref:GTPase n=1 Tax=Marinicella meishanensis TaxID=2873263 RepID=UPI001CC08D14|nr:GTPase [Marinicella sp. NBU2979]
MKLNSKTLLVMALTAMGLVALMVVLVLAEKLLAIWQYLQEAPLWVSVMYASLIVVVAVIPVWLFIKLTRPKVKSKPQVKVIDESSLSAAIEQERSRGVDTQAADAEMQELHSRRSSGQFYISLFGSASTGKSSLIQALIPNAQVAIDVVKGTTIEAHRHQFGQLVITDLPGFDAVDQAELSQLALEESQRAHVVVFLLNTDLARSEMVLFEQLNALHKPMVLALNKVDVYSAAQVQQITAAIEHKTRQQFPVVLINTGGVKPVVVQHADGTESQHHEPIEPKIKPLLSAIELVISNNPDALHRFRDAGILRLAEEKLHSASETFNAEVAQETIERHTRRAIVGALASVAPGSDLVIQGTIGTQLVRELCQLYDVPVNQLQVDQVLKSAGGKLRTSTSLVLAVAGNALKAFPGIGTAAGGIMHAVAYGLIFNSLGKAVMTSVQQEGRLNTELTQQTFEENLLGTSKELAKDLAKMALRLSQQKSPKA